ELGEIENTLRNIDGIDDAVCITIDENDGSKFLSAYFVSDEDLEISFIKEILSRELPNYMVPSFITQIDEIPLTINGKLDIKALPKPEGIRREFIEPSGDVEVKLAEVFCEVLNVDRVSVLDSFFDLGGDSIKAIRIVSKANEKGLSIEVRNIMENPTIRALSKFVRQIGEREYCQDEVIGAVESTPIIKWFNNLKLKNPSYFNQSMSVPLDISEENLRKIFNKLTLHHDVLRSTYNDGELYINPYSAGNYYDLEIIELNTIFDDERLFEEIEFYSNRAQSSIDLNNGPLVKLNYYKTVHGNFLLIIIHHLVVDGVSWRILIDDFNTLLEQIKKNNVDLELPNKTASFIDWSERIQKYKNSYKIEENKSYWKDTLNKSEKINDSKIVDESGVCSIFLDDEHTISL
ncbi:MAG: hypothetical protein HUK28_03030, partial [Methanobrevibacter sp.]|nr:hypothetical protein [Methanobrevibacter sp.]